MEVCLADIAQISVTGRFVALHLTGGSLETIACEDSKVAEALGAMLHQLMAAEPSARINDTILGSTARFCSLDEFLSE